MVYFWLFVIVLLTILEISTVNLVSVWFIASALVSLILSFFIEEITIQVGVFVLLGIVLLLLTRKKLVKLLKVKDEKTNADMVIGKEAIVTEEISKNKIGEVKCLGKRWSAIADTTIKKDSTVIVLDIEGVKLRVEEEK